MKWWTYAALAAMVSAQIFWSEALDRKVADILSVPEPVARMLSALPGWAGIFIVMRLENQRRILTRLREELAGQKVSDRLSCDSE